VERHTGNEPRVKYKRTLDNTKNTGEKYKTRPENVNNRKCIH
jgi:hypothetical protein